MSHHRDGVWDPVGECWVVCPHCIAAMTKPKIQECKHPKSLVKKKYYKTGESYCEGCGLVWMPGAKKIWVFENGKAVRKDME